MRTEQSLLVQQGNGYCEECGNWSYDLTHERGLYVCEKCSEGPEIEGEYFTYGTSTYKEEEIKKKARPVWKPHPPIKRTDYPPPFGLFPEPRKVHPPTDQPPKRMEDLPTVGFSPVPPGLGLRIRFSDVHDSAIVWCQARQDFQKEIYPPGDYVCVQCRGGLPLCNVKLWAARRFWRGIEA